MTRKDYVAIAAAIHEGMRKAALAGDMAYVEGGEYIAEAIADYCAADNPRFDRNRFLKACGL